MAFRLGDSFHKYWISQGMDFIKQKDGFNIIPSPYVLKSMLDDFSEILVVM